MGKLTTGVVVAFGALMAAGMAGCLRTGSLGCCGQPGTPSLILGAHPDAGTVSAQNPNQCEIDVDFGTVATGQRVAASIEIRNTGLGILDLSAINPSLNPEFGLDYGMSPSIAPGSFDSFAVTFEPTQVGTVTSRFTIETDGYNTSCPLPPGPDTTAVVTVVLTGNCG